MEPYRFAHPIRTALVLTTLLFLLAAPLLLLALARVPIIPRVYPPAGTLLPTEHANWPASPRWSAAPEFSAKSSTLPPPSQVLAPKTVSPILLPPSQPPAPTVTAVVEESNKAGHWNIGQSFEGRPLEAYRFGAGPVRIAVIGGIHGGFEGNTVLLVEQMVQYFTENPETVPVSVTLYLVPDANPDGYAQGTGEDARLNANGVDLNRNWDYYWQEYYDWLYGETLYGGPFPFSEPETEALRTMIVGEGITAIIFYHSMGSFVTYPWDESDSWRLANCFSWSTGYGIGDDSFFEYTITGDASSYLGAQGLAAVDVELMDHEDPEWERNLSGLLEGIKCWVEGGGGE